MLLSRDNSGKTATMFQQRIKLVFLPGRFLNFFFFFLKIKFEDYAWPLGTLANITFLTTCLLFFFLEGELPRISSGYISTWKMTEKRYKFLP